MVQVIYTPAELLYVVTGYSRILAFVVTGTLIDLKAVNTRVSG